MAFPRRSSRSPRSRFTLGLLLLTAVTILVLDLPGTGPLDPVRGAFAALFRPIRSAGDAAFRPVSNGWKGAFNYGDVKKQRDQLEAKLAEKDSEQARLRQLERRNAELEKALGFDAGSVKTRAAQVISDPIGNFDHTIEIDKGTGDGVHRGMVVITGGVDDEAAGGQVLGRVSDTTSSTAKVELLTEPSFAVGVTLANGDRGVAQGQGRGKDLVVDGIDKASKVRKGDRVETSGLDRSAFPKDLQVGRVTRVRRSASGDTKILEVTPTADLTSTIVKVVLKRAAQVNPAKVAAVVVGALMLQVSLLARFSYEGARPDVMILVAIAAGFVGGPDRGAIVGFSAGLAYDIVLTSPFGLTALVYTLVGYSVGALSGGILRSAPWIGPAVAAAASAGGMLLYAVIGTVFGEATLDGPPLSAILVVVSVLNALLAPLALRALRWTMADGHDHRTRRFLAR